MRKRCCCGHMDLACPTGHPSAHRSQTAAERVSSQGEDDSARDGAEARSPHSRTPRSSWWSGTCPRQGGPRALQGKSRMQQQAARCTGSRRCALQRGEGPAQHPHPSDVHSAPAALGTMYFCPLAWCRWRTGVQAQPCPLWDNIWGEKHPRTARSRSPGPGPASLCSLLLFMALSGSSHCS